MSKLSFRARALDASKPMPVFCSEDIPDLPDFAAINRAVPQMPTGMEKEEECEHHLQRAISAQQAYGKTGDLVIPTPEVFCCSTAYEVLYIADYKQPRQMIHMQPFAMEQDIPDYDMDSEDERWVNQQAKKMELNSLQFEEMMDRLEKGSGQQVVTLKEAKLLLKEDDDLIIAVYDYWLNKRLRNQHPLIPQVKSEKRDGSTNNNPYVAFRRRTEKMQTRKNRKNDETSYEKMLKLRRDLSRAVTVLEMVKRREKTKREHLHLSIEVFEKRFQAGDFTGQMLQEVMAMRPARPAYVPVQNQFSLQRHDSWTGKSSSKEQPRKKREYKRRKHKQSSVNVSNQSSIAQQYNDMDVIYRGGAYSSDEDVFSAAGSDLEEDNDPDGQFSFRRKKYCNYQSALEKLGNWPWCDGDEEGSKVNLSDKKYRFCLTSLRKPKLTCVGFTRRRMGRGGRTLLDRVYTPHDDRWPNFYRNSSSDDAQTDEGMFDGADDWPHFWPKLSPDDWNDRNTPDLISHYSTAPLTTTFSSNKSAECLGGLTNQTLLTCGLENLMVSDENGIVPIELTVESYQSHQEELLKMQKKQLDHRSSDDAIVTAISEHSPSTPVVASTLPPSGLLLDSASAKFAVSALVNANQLTKVATTFCAVANNFDSSPVTCCASPTVVPKSVNPISTSIKKFSVLNGPSYTSGVTDSSNGGRMSTTSYINTKLSNNTSLNCNENRRQLSSLLVDAPASSSLMSSPSSLSLSSLLSSQPSVPITHNTNGPVTSSSGLSSLLSPGNTSNPVSILATRAVTPKSTPDLKFLDTPIGNAASHTESHEDKAQLAAKMDGLVNENTLPTEVT